MGYRVTASLVQVENTSGNFIQVKKGEVLPSNITDEAIAHVLDFGLVEDESAQGVANIDEMNVKQLKAFAKEHGVDLSGSTTKPDIIAAIELHFDADDDNEE